MLRRGNSTRTVAAALGISQTTVLKHSSETSKFLPGRLQPRLTKEHKRKRYNYARDEIRKQTDWQQVIFTDEKIFTLESKWKGGKWTNVYDSSHFFPNGTLKGKQKTGVMFWAAFGAGRTIALEKIEGNLKSEGYIKIIENSLVPV